MPEIAEFDHEFMTQGSETAEGEKLAGLIQQNLTPEEQGRLQKLWPVLEEVTMLIHKAQTGEFPREAQERGLTNGQGVPEQDMGDTEVAQNMQNQQGVPPRSIEGQMPQNTVNMQGGGPVPGVLQEQQPPQQPPQQVAAGPVGVVDKEGADDSGVADDVQTESDGFVINAAAVRHAGLRDIYNMIKEAVEYLEEHGIKIDTKKIPVDAEEILVSNGEVVIPDIIARVIGYDKLEKINARGEKETEQVQKEVKQEQQVAPPPERPVEETKPPVLQAASGINIGEDKQEHIQKQEAAKEYLDIESQVQTNQKVDEAVKDIGIVNTNERMDTLNLDTTPSTNFVPQEIGDRPTELAEVKYFGFTEDQYYNAIPKYEWRGETPLFGFAKTGKGFTKSGKSSAYGPAQITTSTLGDPELQKLMNSEQKAYTLKIIAAQTLALNLQKYRGSIARAISPRESPKGNAALSMLKITPQEFISFVKDGYFLPSNKTEQIEGIPLELLPENHEELYKQIFSTILSQKFKRRESKDVESFIGSWYGHPNPREKNKYIKGVIQNLI